jgi:hypothetical protein
LGSEKKKLEEELLEEKKKYEDLETNLNEEIDEL